MTGPFPAMRTLEGARESVVTASRWLAIVALAAMFAVVAFNVAARALYDLTDGAVSLLLTGAIEISAYMLLITVFAALPASLGSGMIRVDTFANMLPASLQRLLERIWGIVLALLALLLVYLFAKATATSFARGDTTQDLRVPLYVIYALVTLQSLGLAIVSICEFLSPSSTSTEAV